MEEMRKIARAYYHVGSEEVKRLAHEFFNAMDHDKDKKISKHEFLAFMRQQEGFEQMSNPFFFKDLNKDGSGHLDFWDVMTLYYIVKSRRPFCQGCGDFVNGMFFTCVQCFNNPNPGQAKDNDATFSLCVDCFHHGRYVHRHTNFLDNFMLLEAKRNKHYLADAQAPPNKMNAQPLVSQPSTSTSLAIVPASQANKKKAAFKALEIMVNLGNIASNVASAVCTIM